MCVCSSDKLEYLVQAVESIVNQTLVASILIIYVDGEVSAAADEYLSDLESERLILLRGAQRRGLPSGLNTIIEEVLKNHPAVKYIARMDADDIADVTRLSVQRNYLDARPDVDVLGSWCMEFDDTGEEFLKRMPPQAELLRFSCYRSPLVHPTAFVRRRAFEAGYRYRVDLLKAQDYDLWSRLMCGGYTFDNLQQPLLRYRVNRQMYQRRAGFRLVWRETRMRLLHAYRMKVYSPLVWLKIGGFFAVRISPPAVRVLSYKYFRG